MPETTYMKLWKSLDELTLKPSEREIRRIAEFLRNQAEIRVDFTHDYAAENARLRARVSDLEKQISDLQAELDSRPLKPGKNWRQWGLYT